MKTPSFTEVLETVQRDVTRVASHYPLVTGFFFKVMNQRRSDIRWTEIKDMISIAEGILKEYFHAFDETDVRFVLANVEWELDNFFEMVSA